MRILIVGGSSSLARTLKPILSEFAEVITAGRAGGDIHLDLNDPADRLELPKNVDVVINAAAHFGGTTFDDMLAAENVNVLGVLKLCQACTKTQIKHLVLLSSIFACLDKSSHFYNIYSLSKKHSEELVQLYSSMFGLPFTILRLSQLYGAGEDQRRHQPFFFTIIDKAENGEDILIYGSNDALRNFIHVDDVAAIVALVIRRKIEGVYACANTNNVSYSEVAAAAIDAFHSKSKIKFIQEQPNIPDNIFELDDTLFRLVNYRPQISISLGMKMEVVRRKGKE